MLAAKVVRRRFHELREICAQTVRRSLREKCRLAETKKLGNGACPALRRIDAAIEKKLACTAARIAVEVRY
jgi:hypothetical protein